MKKKLKIKIFDVNNEDCEDEYKFWSKIKKQNEIEKGSISGKIVYRSNKAKYKGIMIVAEVDTNTRKKFLELRRIKVDWKICKVEDSLGILRYYNCNGYYHYAKDCKKIVCGKYI